MAWFQCFRADFIQALVTSGEYDEEQDEFEELDDEESVDISELAVEGRLGFLAWGETGGGEREYRSKVFEGGGTRDALAR